MTTIFEKVKELGIKFDNHHSDLYVPKTKETLALVKEYEKEDRTTNFWNEVEGGWWLDIAFSYDPFFEEKAKSEVVKGNKNKRKKMLSE